MSHPRIEEFKRTVAGIDDREKLLELRAEVEMTLAEIRSQLEESKARAQQGEYSDSEWFHRARSAKRWNGLKHQIVNSRLSLLKDQQRARNKDHRESFAREFVNVARGLLDEDDYQDIVDLAKEKLRNLELSTSDEKSYRESESSL